MKRHFLIWGMVAVLISGVVAIRPVEAFEIDEEGKKWYSTEELLETEDEDNNLFLGQFMITGINVKENKLRILLQDEDKMMIWGEPQKSIFKEIGIMQYKCETDEECSAKFWEIMEHVTSDSLMENAVALYQNMNETDEQTMVVNEEFEVEVVELGDEHDGLGLETGEFQAYMIADNTNSVGGIVYHDCLESPEYEEGMWCKRMVSEDMNIKYMPVWEEKVEEEMAGGESITSEDVANMEIANDDFTAPIVVADVVEEVDDSWEDFAGPEELTPEDFKEYADDEYDGREEDLENEDAEGYEDEPERYNYVQMGDNRKKYQLIGVISVLVAIFSFGFLILCQKSRKKSEKTLDNLEKLI